MKVRLAHLWEMLQASLWFVPACMGLGAVGLALLTHQLDRAVSSGALGWLHGMLYSGDLDGARTLLSTVAGSVITVAGVTFSVTMVALSLASSQFGPRLLVNFMRNRSNQLVLGTFIGTFVFCLLAMGANPSTDIPGFVPAASATLGLLLAVTSMGILVYFIHSISSSIRADNIIAEIAQELGKSMDRYLSRRGEETRAASQRAPECEDVTPDHFIHAPRSGYIQAVDEDGLFEMACAQDVLLTVPVRPGHFVVEGQPIVGIVGGSFDASSMEARLMECFILGRQRTGEQDPEYGIHQLVEVAVRALSPGINDPYTAASCVDWLCSILCSVGEKPMPCSQRFDADGRLRLVRNDLTYAGLLQAAFEQLRQSAHSTPAVSMRILEALAKIGSHVSTADRRTPIREQADMTYAAASEAVVGGRDRQDLEERYQAVAEALEG